MLLRDAPQKNKRDFLGIFPKGGGGVFAIPKTFLYSLFHFLYAKSWKFWGVSLGTDGHTKTDETSEKFQTAFDPPPLHFWKIILRISRQMGDKSAYVHYGGLLCII